MPLRQARAVLNNYVPERQRSCFRCGKTFATDRDRVCPSCKKPKDKPKPGYNAKLSSRELQVADLIMRGEINKQIAFVLNLTEGTVKSYSHNIYRKLGVSNKAALAAWRATHPEAQAGYRVEK